MMLKTMLLIRNEAMVYVFNQSTYMMDFFM